MSSTAGDQGDDTSRSDSGASTQLPTESSSQISIDLRDLHQRLNSLGSDAAAARGAAPGAEAAADMPGVGEANPDGSFCWRLPAEEKHLMATALINDILHYFPIQPSAVSKVSGPVVEFRQVDDNSLDVQVTTQFRTHFDEGLGVVAEEARRVTMMFMAQQRAAAAANQQQQQRRDAGRAQADGGASRVNVEGTPSHACTSATSDELDRSGSDQPARSYDPLRPSPGYHGRQGGSGSSGEGAAAGMPPAPSARSTPTPADAASAAANGTPPVSPFAAAAGPAPAAHGKGLPNGDTAHLAPLPVAVAPRVRGRRGRRAAALARASSVPIVEEVDSELELDGAMPGRRGAAGAGGWAVGGRGLLVSPGRDLGLLHPALHARATQKLRMQMDSAAFRLPFGPGCMNLDSARLRGDQSQAAHYLEYPAGLDQYLLQPPPGEAGSSILATRSRSEWDLDPSKILIGRRIAVGGFAEVFVGKYEGTVVAIKRILSSEPGTIEKFAREVRLLARLRHPNVLLFMGCCTSPELVIVSEFMARGSLYNVLRQCGEKRLEPKLQRAVALSVARGMAYLHSRSPPILHLDLKSPNILVDDRWRIKIADFGLSKVRSRSFVQSGTGGGTPEWMAPEMLRNERFDEAADVYSYGVVLWELLTGLPPWESLNSMQVVATVAFGNMGLPAPTEGEPFLIQLCMDCMSFEPTKRPSFPDIVAALNAQYSSATWQAMSQPLLATAPAATGGGAPAGRRQLRIAAGPHAGTPPASLDPKVAQSPPPPDAASRVAPCEPVNGRLTNGVDGADGTMGAVAAGAGSPAAAGATANNPFAAAAVNDPFAAMALQPFSRSATANGSLSAAVLQHQQKQAREESEQQLRQQAREENEQELRQQLQEQQQQRQQQRQRVRRGEAGGNGLRMGPVPYSPFARASAGPRPVAEVRDAEAAAARATGDDPAPVVAAVAAAPPPAPAAPPLFSPFAAVADQPPCDDDAVEAAAQAAPAAEAPTIRTMSPGSLHTMESAFDQRAPPRTFPVTHPAAACDAAHGDAAVAAAAAALLASPSISQEPASPPPTSPAGVFKWPSTGDVDAAASAVTGAAGRAGKAAPEGVWPPAAAEQGTFLHGYALQPPQDHQQHDAREEPAAAAGSSLAGTPLSCHSPRAIPPTLHVFDKPRRRAERGAAQRSHPDADCDLRGNDASSLHGGDSRRTSDSVAEGSEVERCPPAAYQGTGNGEDASAAGDAGSSGSAWPSCGDSPRIGAQAAAEVSPADAGPTTPRATAAVLAGALPRSQSSPVLLSLGRASPALQRGRGHPSPGVGALLPGALLRSDEAWQQQQQQQQLGAEEEQQRREVELMHLLDPQVGGALYDQQLQQQQQQPNYMGAYPQPHHHTAASYSPGGGAARHASTPAPLQPMYILQSVTDTSDGSCMLSVSSGTSFTSSVPLFSMSLPPPGSLQLSFSPSNSQHVRPPPLQPLQPLQAPYEHGLSGGNNGQRGEAQLMQPPPLQELHYHQQQQCLYCCSPGVPPASIPVGVAATAERANTASSDTPRSPWELHRQDTLPFHNVQPLYQHEQQQQQQQYQQRSAMQQHAHYTEAVRAMSEQLQQAPNGGGHYVCPAAAPMSSTTSEQLYGAPSEGSDPYVLGGLLAAADSGATVGVEHEGTDPPGTDGQPSPDAGHAQVAPTDGDAHSASTAAGVEVHYAASGFYAAAAPPSQQPGYGSPSMLHAATADAAAAGLLAPALGVPACFSCLGPSSVEQSPLISPHVQGPAAGTRGGSGADVVAPQLPAPMQYQTGRFRITTSYRSHGTQLLPSGAPILVMQQGPPGGVPATAGNSLADNPRGPAGPSSSPGFMMADQRRSAAAAFGGAPPSLAPVAAHQHYSLPSSILAEVQAGAAAAAMVNAAQHELRRIYRKGRFSVTEEAQSRPTSASSGASLDAYSWTPTGEVVGMQHHMPVQQQQQQLLAFGGGSAEQQQLLPASSGGGRQRRKSAVDLPPRRAERHSIGSIGECTADLSAAQWARRPAVPADRRLSNDIIPFDDVRSSTQPRTAPPAAVAMRAAAVAPQRTATQSTAAAAGAAAATARGTDTDTVKQLDQKRQQQQQQQQQVAAGAGVAAGPLPAPLTSPKPGPAVPKPSQQQQQSAAASQGVALPPLSLTPALPQSAAGSDPHAQCPSAPLIVRRTGAHVPLLVRTGSFLNSDSANSSLVTTPVALSSYNYVAERPFIVATAPSSSSALPTPSTATAGNLSESRHYHRGRFDVHEELRRLSGTAAGITPAASPAPVLQPSGQAQAPRWQSVVPSAAVSPSGPAVQLSDGGVVAQQQPAAAQGVLAAAAPAVAPVGGLAAGDTVAAVLEQPVSVTRVGRFIVRSASRNSNVPTPLLPPSDSAPTALSGLSSPVRVVTTVSGPVSTSTLTSPTGPAGSSMQQQPAATPPPPACELERSEEALPGVLSPLAPPNATAATAGTALSAPAADGTTGKVVQKGRFKVATTPGVASPAPQRGPSRASTPGAAAAATAPSSRGNATPYLVALMAAPPTVSTEAASGAPPAAKVPAAAPAAAASADAIAVPVRDVVACLSSGVPAAAATTNGGAQLPPSVGVCNAPVTAEGPGAVLDGVPAPGMAADGSSRDGAQAAAPGYSTIAVAVAPAAAAAAQPAVPAAGTPCVYYHGAAPPPACADAMSWQFAQQRMQQPSPSVAVPAAGTNIVGTPLQQPPTPCHVPYAAPAVPRFPVSVAHNGTCAFGIVEPVLGTPMGAPQVVLGSPAAPPPAALAAQQQQQGHTFLAGVPAPIMSVVPSGVQASPAQQQYVYAALGVPVGGFTGQRQLTALGVPARVPFLQSAHTHT